jgi:hypothetical protein
VSTPSPNLLSNQKWDRFPGKQSRQYVQPNTVFL